MRKQLIVFILACVLLLAACAGLAASEPAALLDRASGQAEDASEAVYALEPVTRFCSILSEDGKDVELVTCDYQLLSLSVTRPEVPSGEDPAAQNWLTFNDRMVNLLMEYLEEQAKTMGEDAKSVYEDGYWNEAYFDEVATTGGIMGSIVSIRMDRSSYTGGAHPNSYVSGSLFDLTSGQFILDPIQLAEDPAAFRAGAAELLVEKANAYVEDKAENFWEDYAEVIARWNEGTVQFTSEGMKVIYSPYELGPYSMGVVELLLTWEELAPLLGNSGMERFGELS